TSPRALVIAAYRNVQINNFSAVGDGKFTANQPVIAVQFMAENVMFNGINVTGFKNASTDIKLFGGRNRGKTSTVTNANIWNTSRDRRRAGRAGLDDIGIINAKIRGQGTGNGIELYSHTAEVIGGDADNYKNPTVIGGKEYATVPTFLKGGFNGGTTGSSPLSSRSAIFASTGGSFAHSARSWVAGSGANSHAWGSRSAVLNSLESETSSGRYVQTIVN